MGLSQWYTADLTKARLMDLGRTTVFDSSLGWMAAVWVQTRVHALTFGHSSPIEALGKLKLTSDPTGPDHFMRVLIRRLQALADGECGDTFRDIKIETSGLTEFQRVVTQTCRRIPVGQTLTYGDLARRAGHAGAARAVGRVMSCNRFPLIVPCHRVVAANSLGGFSSPEGLNMKRRLLAAEADHLSNDRGHPVGRRDQEGLICMPS